MNIITQDVQDIRRACEMLAVDKFPQEFFACFFHEYYFLSDVPRSLSFV